MTVMQPMCRELRGPVTHVGHMKGGDLEGVFLVTYGNRVETHFWTGEKLQRVAFYDAPILVSSVAVIKSFLVIGDVHKGLVFLQASNGGRQLTELGRVCPCTAFGVVQFTVSGCCKQGTITGPSDGTVLYLIYNVYSNRVW